MNCMSYELHQKKVEVNNNKHKKAGLLVTTISFSCSSSLHLLLIVLTSKVPGQLGLQAWSWAAATGKIEWWSKETP